MLYGSHASSSSSSTISNVGVNVTLTLSSEGVLTHTVSGQEGELGRQHTLLRPNATSEIYPQWTSLTTTDTSVEASGIIVIAGSSATNGSIELHTDRQGGDYNHFDLGMNDAPQICQVACNKDRPKCKAWAWTCPGMQGQEPVCWLKSVVPSVTTNDTCVVSGISGTPATSPAQLSVHKKISLPEFCLDAAARNTSARNLATARCTSVTSTLTCQSSGGCSFVSFEVCTRHT